MTDSGISYALVAVPGESGRGWADQARAVEQPGLDQPPRPGHDVDPSPFPALAAAAGATNTLRLRTWVIAAPLRSPAAVVREAAALQRLSDGRFELGIGSGRPDAEQRCGPVGRPLGTGRQRIDQAADGDHRGAGAGSAPAGDRCRRSGSQDAELRLPRWRTGSRWSFPRGDGAGTRRRRRARADCGGPRPPVEPATRRPGGPAAGLVGARWP